MAELGHDTLKIHHDWFNKSTIKGKTLFLNLEVLQLNCVKLFFVLTSLPCRLPRLGGSQLEKVGDLAIDIAKFIRGYK